MSSTEHTLGSAEIEPFLCKRDSNRDPSKYYAAMDLFEKNPLSGAQSEVKLLKPMLSLSSISINEDENTFAETSSTRTTDEDTLDDISSCPSPQRLSLIYQQILEIGIKNMYCTLTRELKTFMSALCSTLLIRFRNWTISGTDVLRRALKSIPSPAIHSYFRVLQSSATRCKTALVRLPTLFIVLGKIPGVVAAGCQFGVDDFSLSLGSILDQISGQTLLLSIGATFGGYQSFANDHRLAFGLLSIGVAGMNGAHSASELLSQGSDIPISLTENERNDLLAGPWRYAGLVARLLRLFWTSLTSIAIGICTCYLVAIGWSVVLVLTIALVIYGETYAPLKLVIYENAYSAPFMCYRDDGSSAVDWRYTITPHGSYIVHNNSLQNKFSHRRTTPAIALYWVSLELKRWNGTYFASGLSFVTWIWWLLSLQLLTPWSWAPRFILLAGVLSLLIAEWCNSVDAQESSYGFSRRALAVRSKLQELTFMYFASGVKNLLNEQERMVMTKMVAETMIASGELNEVSSRLESSHTNDTPTVVGTKLHEFYTMGVPLSPILQHEKERLGVIGNPWPHMGVVEWAIA